MSKLIFGCGYLGSRVAKRWRSAGHDVFAVTRSPERAADFRAAGLQPIVADILNPETLRDLPAAETVLFAVGYDRRSASSIGDVYAHGLAGASAALPESPRQFIYVSSTGVYGDERGGWVDEATPCRPAREGGRACLAAETLLLESKLRDRAVILRLAGIYGPGRIPQAEAIRAGEPIAAPAEGYLNLIHVDDAAAIVLRSEGLGDLPQTLNVSDGRPVLRGDYYRELAQLLDAPSPKFTQPNASSPVAARAAADKRIDNRRMIETLRPKLCYPSYREGLAAIVDSSEA